MSVSECLVIIVMFLWWARSSASGGQWRLLQSNIGITAMHMQLLHNDRVVIFDRTDFGKSNISLPQSKCRNDPSELVIKADCTAHSVDYDVLRNRLRPLTVQTDVWCSSGAVMQDGVLVQTGGFNDGDRMVRRFSPCQNDLCDWQETGNGLQNRRWYATNHILPDGRQIIIGGRKQFNYEFYPKNPVPEAFDFPFLAQTNDPGVENNLYPFVFLNVDGNLFIFANNRAVLFNYKTNGVVRTYPTIPDGNPRSYPSTGSAVLLPLILSPNGGNVEVLVCGGAPKASFLLAKRRRYARALNTCARIKVNDRNPQWEMDTMPMGRVMGDMILLPNGDVLIINGAGLGVAGWENARDPVLYPVVYDPSKPRGSRFETQNPTSIPRLYHSTAILLRDGRILVGGSNPHIGYEFGKTTLFPTELRLEAFHPSYLDPHFYSLRPTILYPMSSPLVKHAQELTIVFRLTANLLRGSVSITLISPSFTTHSFSMNHRLLVLAAQQPTAVAPATYQIIADLPNSNILAPPGFYMLFVVHQKIPSVGTWIQIN